MSCCYKKVYNGCVYANDIRVRELKESRNTHAHSAGGHSRDQKQKPT
ncbi:hypothetical protein QTG54_002119 [Skeletonema marinoi]|uniref:Uncharacterized protein n=1 Tax=Skeletonema marinoi TaxID=267567 RepID=A0AAD9DI98_9STRA|nr:hypothetical protein QTG54_002119 [Skeletonema marinoi]